MKYLGKCLAIIGSKGNKSNPILKYDGGSNQKSVEQFIEKRFNDITSSKYDMLLNINIPDGSCFVDRPFLENNIDFFLLYLGIVCSPNNGTIDCSRLMKHLNDCYRCFDVYCNTIQEFLLEKEQLLRK